MNTKRIFTWGTFVLIIGLIIWGMIAAANKAEKESAGIAPVNEVTSSDWVMGNASSTVTLIEYSDFQCPSCAAYFPIVEKVVTENSSKLQFVYRHFPLTQHLNAVPASRAAEASGMQGKFWEMYKMIFENQKEWEDSKDAKGIFVGYAIKLGLDAKKFTTDFELPEIQTKLDASIKSGIKAGVQGTPTFYLNGKKIVSPQTYDEFKKLIDQAS
jgi:protein-disulfide isomerase